MLIHVRKSTDHLEMWNLVAQPPDVFWHAVDRISRSTIDDSGNGSQKVEYSASRSLLHPYEQVQAHKGVTMIDPHCSLPVKFWWKHDISMLQKFEDELTLTWKKTKHDLLWNISEMIVFTAESWSTYHYSHGCHERREVFANFHSSHWLSGIDLGFTVSYFTHCLWIQAQSLRFVVNRHQRLRWASPWDASQDLDIYGE